MIVVLAIVAFGLIRACGAVQSRPASSLRRSGHGVREEAGQLEQAARTHEQLLQAARTHEVPTPAPPQHAQGANSAVQAVDTFATIYINWTAQSVAAQMTDLALASIGQARSEMALAAAQTGHDPQLREAGIANSGTVESVAGLPGRDDQYVVVTRESTSATDTSAYEGLAPAWHVSIATVIELAPGRWVLSGWQPES